MVDASSTTNQEPAQAPRTTARTAPIVVALVGSALALPLLVVPALSRGTLSSLLWLIREGGSGMLLLLPLGLGVCAVVAILGALRGRGVLRVAGLALPVLLPLVGFGFYRLGMGKAFTAISGASVEPLVKLRILAEGASEVGNLLSLAAFLCVAAAFVAAVWAFASAIAASPRLTFGPSAAIGGGLALIGVGIALAIATRQPGETWHWLQGALVVLFGTPLALVALAALDGAGSGSSGAPETRRATSMHTFVALCALCASLMAAYCSARNEITNLMFSAVGGESIDVTRREEYLRAGLAALAGIRVAYAGLAVPLLAMLVTLLVFSGGRALGPSSLRDAGAVALAPLVVAGVVRVSPEAAWAFIQVTSAKAQPRNFAFISTERSSLDRHGGFALYLDASSLTVGGKGALQTMSLEPNADCPKRLEQLLRSLPNEDFRGPALAIAQDATLPGIRCGVLGTLLFRGIRLIESEPSSGEVPRFDSTSFDLIVQHGSDASDLPRPFDALAPHRGSISVEIAPRPSWARAERLHLTGEAWRFGSEGAGEQRITGDDESRFEQLRARLSSQREVLEVSADPDVRAELLVRALLLSDSARLVLEAPSHPPGLDGLLGPVVPRAGAHPTVKVRMGATTVSGRLPPEIIQRIVRQNYGRFRMCYEQGLGRNPGLQGRVSVRFVIDPAGAVANVASTGSDLPDAGVVGCVARAFYGLSFPRPESGIVTVVYPILFSTG